MRVYRYSWGSEGKGIEITVDSGVLMSLILMFKAQIKDAVERNDFESARRCFSDLDILEARLEELLEREKEDDNPKTE